VSLSSILAELRFEVRQSEFVLPTQIMLAGAFGDPHNAFYTNLAAVTAALNPQSVIEVGTYLGLGTLTLAKNAPHARIITIDLPDSGLARPERLDTNDRSHVERSRGRVGLAFGDTVEASRITQVLQDSTSMRFSNLVDEADLVLIDGGHAYDIVAEDSRNALSVLSPTGVVLWDDYAYFYPGVVRYLDQLSSEIPLRRIAGTNMVIYNRQQSDTKRD
jgi:predicted O-methyltransferase YrrM